LSDKRFFISAGEASGDLHAANLMRELKRLRPDSEFLGLGGAEMARAGCRLLEDTVARSGMWFMHLWKNFFWYLRLLHRAVRSLDEFKPDAVVLVDNPGFNVRLALHARERNIPVIYYIAPQTWAWGQWRINKITRRVNRMLVILPFEEEFWRRFGMTADYVGHPLFDYLASLDLPANRTREERKVGLFPGSRITEATRLLPIMLGAVRLIAEQMPDVRFAVSRPREQLCDAVEKIIETHGKGLPISIEDTHDLAQTSTVCITASGTATLELAYFGTPMVVIYRVVFYGKPVCPIFVTTDYISLVNIIANREIVPELFMYHDDTKGIAEATMRFLRDEDYRERCGRELLELSRWFGKAGASRRAAESIVKFLKGLS